MPRYKNSYKTHKNYYTKNNNLHYTHHPKPFKILITLFNHTKRLLTTSPAPQNNPTHQKNNQTPIEKSFLKVSDFPFRTPFFPILHYKLATSCHLQVRPVHCDRKLVIVSSIDRSGPDTRRRQNRRDARFDKSFV